MSAVQSRRVFLRGIGLAAAGGALAACGATPTAQVIEKEVVVTQVVQVEVTKLVEGTPQVVTQEVVATSTPAPMSIACVGHVTLGYYTSTTPAIERMKKQEAGFNEQFPDVDLEIIQMTNTTDKYATMLAAGNEPHVMWVGTEFWQFVGGGTYLQLDPLVDSDPDFRREEYYPQPLDYFTWRGGLYALPYGMDCDIYAYNLDLVEAAGLSAPSDTWTHDDYIAYGQAMTKDTDGDGRIDEFGVTDAGWYQYVWQEGGDVLTPECDRAILDTPEAIAGLQLTYDISAGKYKIAPTPDQTKESGPLPLFTTGKVGIRITYPAHMPVYRESAKFRWDVVAAPNQKGTWFNPEGYNISARTPDKGAAWCLVKYLCSSESQRSFYAVEKSAIPAIRSIAESDVWLEGGPANMGAFAAALEYERHWPKHPISMEAWTIVQVFIDQMMAGDITAEEAGKGMTDGLNAKLVEYQGA